MGIPFDAMCKDIHFLSYRKETLHTRLYLPVIMHGNSTTQSDIII